MAARRCSGPRATPGCSYGARDYALLPAGPAPTRSMRSHTRSVTWCRNWRGAGDGRRHKFVNNTPPRGSDDPARSASSPRSRSTGGAAAPALRRILRASLTSTTSTRPAGPPSSGREECDAGEPPCSPAPWLFLPATPVRAQQPDPHRGARGNTAEQMLTDNRTAPSLTASINKFLGRAFFQRHPPPEDRS